MAKKLYDWSTIEKELKHISIYIVAKNHNISTSTIYSHCRDNNIALQRKGQSDDILRNKKKIWEQYMEQNPFYFQTIFPNQTLQEAMIEALSFLD